MRSLWLKIFVWFWLAMALMAMAMVFVTVTTQTGERASRWRPLVGSGLHFSGRAAAEAWERRGQGGLLRLLEQVEANADTTALLFDHELRELSGREIPAGARRLAARVLDGRGRGFETTEGLQMAGRRVAGPSGQRYAIVSVLPQLEMPRSTRGVRLLRNLFDNPFRLWTRLAVGFLTAGLVCYGLARYLTAPVRELREATRELAAGNLAARVGPAVEGRYDEIADLGRDFDRMAERIEGLLTTQRRLLSDVSHELRSPLARLNVALGLAQRKAGPGSREALARIERESERLNELIGQVLVLARLESGVLEREKVRVDLAGLLEAVVTDADFEARDGGRRVELDVRDPAVARGSEHLLRSAVENVVRNAVRYTAEGTAVQVELRRLEDVALIRVRDHGPGVAEEVLADLFEPFYRVEDSRDRGKGGTGLGLAIARRAVQVHDGTVTARNAPGTGLVVELRVPVE